MRFPSGMISRPWDVLGNTEKEYHQLATKSRT
jgi:hypothetical protein